MKICHQIADDFCQSSPSKNLKIFYIYTEWQNLAKSDHTGYKPKE